MLLEASLPDLPLRLLAEGERLHRILNNIVHNAIRHTPSGGTVRVGVEPATNRTLITVQDSCGGIPEAHLHRVFDRLWRGERARTTAGAGLGLTIAAALAHLHGGSLSVRNHQPGCEFTLALPMPPTGNSPVLAQRDQNLSRPTVLPTLS